MRAGLARRTFLAASAALGTAAALGRTPTGGVVRWVLPWPVDSIDPHAHDDMSGALFGAAITDSLYALDAEGRPYPALASGLPESVERGSRVRLRPNLMTARGLGLDARDVLASLLRSAQFAGVGLLSQLGRITLDPTDPLAIRIATADARLVAAVLASPVTAIVPRGFSPRSPDGTGAFRATLSPGRALLARNPVAARGPSFLERIEVRRATTLSESLRAFETREAELSWLGEYLHRPRPGAVRFDAGTAGWVTLRAGPDTGEWGAPGVLQTLLDAIAPGQLSHLGLSGLPWAPRGSPAWTGAPAELLVADDCPQLAQIGRQLATLMGRPGHELRAVERPRPELAQRRRSGRFALLLELTRRVAPGPRGAMLSVLSHLAPDLARRPPAHAPEDARRLGATLRAGVVGELGIRGAQIPELSSLSRWELGAVWRQR